MKNKVSILPFGGVARRKLFLLFCFLCPMFVSGQYTPSVIRTSIPDLKVGVMLPFEETKMVEFYRGMLMAADSVRQSGVNIDIYAWDCGSSRSRIEDLLSEISGLDILFGPTSPVQVPLVAELCRELGVRLVLPFPNALPLTDFPLVFSATAPNAVVLDDAARKLTNYFADGNFVVVRSGNADNGGNLFTKALTQKLAAEKAAPKHLEIEGNDFAYESAFNQFRSNVVLVDDASVRSLNILLARLKDFHQKHPDYAITLVGYPQWQDESGRLLNDFFTFNTYIISPYYYNVFDSRTKHFQRTYERNFRTPIAQGSPRYAAFGFDLGFYFLNGFSTLGDTFERMQEGILQEPYQNRFRFERTVSDMSFTNRFVQFIHYTRDGLIELVR